jgi:hypothetical protein
MSYRNSVFDFFKSSIETHASPPVLLDVGYHDPDDMLTFQVKVPSP